MKKIIYLTFFTSLLLACSSKQEAQNNKSFPDSTIDSSITKQTSDSIKSNTKESSTLENTVWTHQVFSDNLGCIDSIKFANKKSGFFYSCEHDLSDSINYIVSNDTLRINKWDYKSQLDASKGKEIVSKYILKIKDSSLDMIDIQHKVGDKFQSIDPKHINQEYKKIK